MDVKQAKYYWKVVRRGYKEISLWIWLLNLIFLIICAVSTFLLLAYEPVEDWHHTSFILESSEYRYVKGGAVLDIYTNDGREFVINVNEDNVAKHLEKGQIYSAVYSDDRFHDIIKALSCGENELLSIEYTSKNYRRDRLIWMSSAIISFLLIILANAFCVVCIIKEDKRRIRKYMKSRKK